MPTLVEEAFRSHIWNPPALVKNPVNDHWDAFLKTISGETVHVRLFSAIADQNTYELDSRHDLIIYFHGNAEDLTTSASFLAWLALHTSYNVLGLDYVGYGRSSHESTTELNMCEAADAVLEYATSTLKYKHHSISVIGRSLGSIAAVHLASRKHNAGLQGLVLISAFASGARCFFSSAYIPHILQNSLDNAFGNNIQKISEVQCMILLVHGDKDTTVKFENAEQLQAKCNCWCQAQLVKIKNGDHNNLFEQKSKEVLVYLIQFLGNSKENARLHSCDEESKTPYSPFDW